MSAEDDQIATGVYDAIAAYVAAKLAPLQSRIQELEAELAQRPETIKSLERRASRQGDHLAKLEDRTKALERG